MPVVTGLDMNVLPWQVRLMSESISRTAAGHVYRSAPTDTAMRLHVPYNNDRALIDRLIPYASHIRSLYLPCNHTVLGSGRYEGRASNRNWETYDRELLEIAETLAPHDITVNMLLNSIHVSSDVLNNFQGSPLYQYLQKFEGSLVEWLTVANIQLAILIRKHFPRFKLDVSVLALIDSLKKAQYWYDLVRPDLFCVDLDHGKDLQLIHDITAVTGVPVKVLVMDFCLPDCPYKPCHYIHNALKEENAFSCWGIRGDKPWYYYKGRTIPPFFLHQYIGLINDIKIVERNSDSDTIIQNVRQYVEEVDSRFMVYRGGIVPGDRGKLIISPTVDKLYYNLNSKHPLFKEVPVAVFEKTVACDHNCGVCTFCYDAWKEEWQVSESYELLSDYLKRWYVDGGKRDYYQRLLDHLHGQRHNVTFIESIKLMKEYVDGPFLQLLDYFTALAFLEAKSRLAEPYLERLALTAPELLSHLSQLQDSFRCRNVITYTPFDQYDECSFVTLNALESAGTADVSDCFRLIELLLSMGEEQAAEKHIASLTCDDELFVCLCLSAFNSGCYATVFRLCNTSVSAGLLTDSQRSRLELMAYFCCEMTGTVSVQEVPGPFMTSNSYSHKENYARLYLNYRYHGLLPTRSEQEALLFYVSSLRRDKKRRDARTVYRFCLVLNPDHITLLKGYHELLLEMNLVEEGREVAGTIDQLYQKSRLIFDQIGTIPQSLQRLSALALQYHSIKDYENAALNAAKVVDNDPTSSRAWDLLFSSLKQKGDYSAYGNYSRLRGELLTKSKNVEQAQLLSVGETARFRGHPHSARMIQMVERLGVPYRVERSFKFGRNRLLCNRFIMTIRLKEVEGGGGDAVVALCRDISLPEPCLRMLIQRMSTASKVHFGFEEEGERSFLKVYLEYSYNLAEHMERSGGCEPWQLLLAFKWDPGEPSRYVVSDYRGFPSFTTEQVQERVAANFPYRQGSIVMPLLTAILRKYDEVAHHQPIWYLDVTEEGTPRKSFDIKTYRARLSMGELLPYLHELCRWSGIPWQQFAPYFESIKGHKFGHLSCGLGRDGAEYVALYHELPGQ